MTAQQFKRLGSDDQLRKRLAKFLVQQCVRNTELENLHAGKVPDSKTGDFSDVQVVTPYGEIPWNELSRMSNNEMKVLMIEVVNKTYTFLTILFTAGQSQVETVLNGLDKVDLVPQWNEPEITRL